MTTDTEDSDIAPSSRTIDLSPYLFLTNSSTTPQRQSINLSLLAPLADPAILSRCPDIYYPTTVKRYESPKEESHPRHTYLNLCSVTTAWRSLFRTLPLLSSSQTTLHITFDLNMPAPENHSDGLITPKIDWDVNAQAEGGIYVRVTEVKTLVMTIASAAKMRAVRNAAEVSFEVLHGFISRPEVMTAIKKDLMALERNEREWVMVVR